MLEVYAEDLGALEPFRENNRRYSAKDACCC